jgi:SRSO17 transposase
MVLADSAYGNDGKFRSGISEFCLPYVVGVFSSMLVWRPGEAPVPRAPGSGRARRVKPVGQDSQDKSPRPVSVKALAKELPADDW